MARVQAAMVVTVTSIFLALVGCYSLGLPKGGPCLPEIVHATYIPVPLSHRSYSLYLYHERHDPYEVIDSGEHVRQLAGVPVLFIPGSRGSYEDVRALAAKSDRLYHQVGARYSRRLDWFSVHLGEEVSEFEGRIVEAHTDYVIRAIDEILDQYRQSLVARLIDRIDDADETPENEDDVPSNVILVGHDMGGFVARAVVVHPRLRMSTVQTILTLATPHQHHPFALPSLRLHFACVNHEWRKGFEVQDAYGIGSDALLSHVVVVSITTGLNDYLVPTKLQSLEGIVPPSSGLTISTTSMKDVGFSVDRSTVWWCPQIAVQTLLSLADYQRHETYHDSSRSLAIVSETLRSETIHAFDSLRFTVLYWPQMLGHCIAVILFGLMRQRVVLSRRQSMPSLSTAIRENLRMKHFWLLVIVPISASLVWWSQTPPPLKSFAGISVISYILSNGVVLMVTWMFEIVFYMSANARVFISRSLQEWGSIPSSLMLGRFMDQTGFFWSAVDWLEKANPSYVTMVATPLVGFFHPRLGFLVPLISVLLRRHSMAWILELVKANPSYVTMVATPLVGFFHPRLGCLVPLLISVLVRRHSMACISEKIFHLATKAYHFISESEKVQAWGRHPVFLILRWFMDQTGFFLSTVDRLVRAYPHAVPTVASILVSFVHPALGLFVPLISELLRCHFAKCSLEGQTGAADNGARLMIFHHQLSLLVLHLFVILLFAPSLLLGIFFRRRKSLLMSIVMGLRLPLSTDFVLCFFAVLHGIWSQGHNFPYGVRTSEVYLILGWVWFLSGQALDPMLGIHPFAVVGFLSPLLKRPPVDQQ